MKVFGIFIVAIFLIVGTARAGDITIKVRELTAKGPGKVIGTIRAFDTKKGLKLVLRLSGLMPGMHGFHVHQMPNCGSKGMGGKMGPGLAAGGHFDPSKTGHHLGPEMHGHRGDLPNLSVAKNGKARRAVIAPHLRVADLRGRSIMIHGHSDNYSDSPKALGGSGPRVACGVVFKGKGRSRKSM